VSSDCHTPPTVPDEHPVALAPDAPPPPDVKPSRLIGTLAGFGAVAGLLIVLVFQWAQPRIQRHQAEVLQAAIQEVLAEPSRVQTVFVYQNRLVDALPAGVDSAGLDRVYLGLDAAGRPKGFAVTAGEAGFNDIISLIFGYDAASGRIMGMKVLDQKETPGMGDRVEKDSAFRNGFAGALSPIQGIKQTTARTDPHQVDMITGATISSRAVIKSINDRLEKIGPLLKAYRYGGSR
jgi:electron transport complex protein RnfG